MKLRVLLVGVAFAIALGCSSGGGDGGDARLEPTKQAVVALGELMSQGKGDWCALTPSISRDGEHLVVVLGTQTDHEAPCKNQAVVVIDIATGESKKVSEVGQNPRWLPDGKKVVFETGQEERIASCGRRATLADVESGDQRVWLEPLASIEGFSPDGELALVTVCDGDDYGRRESILVDLDGRVVHRFGALAIAWTEDGDVVMGRGSSIGPRILSVDGDDVEPAPSPVVIIQQTRYPWPTSLEPCRDDSGLWDPPCY